MTWWHIIECLDGIAWTQYRDVAGSVSHVIEDAVYGTDKQAAPV